MNRRDALGPGNEQRNERSNKQHNEDVLRVVNLVMSGATSSAITLAMSGQDDMRGTSNVKRNECGNEHRHEQGK